jgi:hypothetical protein
MKDTLFPFSMLSDEELRRHMQRLRGTAEADPNASLIVPISARSGFSLIQGLIGDLARYRGSYTLEIILMVAASLAGSAPEEIEHLRGLGLQVIAAPEGGQNWEAVQLEARAQGVEAARAGITLHFSPDARLPDATALIDWYIQSLYSVYQLAYSQISYYGLPDGMNTRLSLALVDTFRKVKRVLLGVPTTRGSNYAINRHLFLKLYESGKLTVDLPVGLAVRLAEARSRYSSERRLQVYLSAHKYSPQSLLNLHRILRRLRYNLRAIPLTFHSSEWANWRVFTDELDKGDQFPSPFAKENR